MKKDREIAQLVQMACVWESCAPKPGNVTRYHDFSDTCLEDFLLSAIAVGPAFEAAGESSVGEIIWQATVDTRRRVPTNTNLGLILLLAPLAKACHGAHEVKSIRKNLQAILSTLTVDDARKAYAAIRTAQPGGLGKVPYADVEEEPSITLLQAMELAKDRDSIAREYATGFEITFEIGLPALSENRSLGVDFSNAIVQTFLTILAKVPDTLIARKKGTEVARHVSERAGAVLNLGGVFTPQGREELEDMDRLLRDDKHRLNPGTTADLTGAAVFLSLFESQSV